MLLRYWEVVFKTHMWKNTGLEYEVQVTANFPGQFLKSMLVAFCRKMATNT